MSSVNIHLRVSHAEIQFSDVNDQCFKKAVANYEIVIHPKKVKLHLHDFNYDVNYIDSEGIGYNPKDKEADVAFLVAKTVIGKLNEVDCVGKEDVSFQSRRGYPHEPDSYLSGLRFFNDSISHTLALGQGIVTHTFAYLSERQIVIFLNKTTDDATIQKITDVMKSLFKPPYTATESGPSNTTLQKRGRGSAHCSSDEREESPPPTKQE